MDRTPDMHVYFLDLGFFPLFYESMVSLSLSLSRSIAGPGRAINLVSGKEETVEN